MGHSQAQKAETHRRIVEIASRRFLEVGLQGIGVSDVMKEAGLTAGGFYKHFGSREDLVAEAVGLAIERIESELKSSRIWPFSPSPPSSGPSRSASYSRHHRS